MSLVPQKWNLSALSMELGVDRRYLAKHIKTVDPCGRDGRSDFYWLADVVKALYAPAELSYQQETAKLRKAQTERTEIQISKERGDLVPTQLVRRVVGDMTAAFKARAMSLPSTVAPVVPGKSVEQVEVLLRKRVNEMLAELKDFDPGECRSDDQGVDDGDSPDDGPAPKPKRKRVGRPRKSSVKRSKRGAGKVADK